ncbi:hypothetical protein HX004_14095 [Myroides sp. 1354]|uniref:hypothetical protein n=1 Tax=unclassified Myroides TaxID=2642485 RepID=UPI00257511AC|nr:MULTISPECIES: hypothetical protein [unclassified Myroides]MDM1045886.1 hypothetical protein [Myroides sp. R163-1]MDM1056896.1 hypothetical protein [Myroides sp. 1354]MDM1070091.1 hypothetical protein [Myroides sp. 1372]
MQEIIDSIIDLEYKQLLITVWLNLPENQHKMFMDILQRAIKNDKKIFVDEENLNFNWDSLRISNIKIND